jgi:hypothetical protein
MVNKAMERAIRKRECLDVRQMGVTIGPGLYRLERYVDDVDYCDAQNESYLEYRKAQGVRGDIRGHGFSIL